ncbi:cell division protein ZapA [Lentilactobacillus otakiensis]|uniref:cell division protein ZapA n=1 Tax=Lentilactobacillus otakiensis TaxID=481720 RepID=UPI003D16B8C2
MSNNEKRRFKATIDGKDYVLVGKGTVDHMQAVTDLLNEQLKQLHEAMPTSTEEQRAILIAFNAISKQFEVEENTHNKEVR